MCAMRTLTFAYVICGTLFADLCRMKDSRPPTKFLVGVETMFHHADEIYPVVFKRLTDWVLYDLNDFGYNWNWLEWTVLC